MSSHRFARQAWLTLASFAGCLSMSPSMRASGQQLSGNEFAPVLHAEEYARVDGAPQHPSQVLQLSPISKELPRSAFDSDLIEVPADASPSDLNEILFAPSEINLDGTRLKVLEMLDEEEVDVMFGDWLGYNSSKSDTTWVTGGGDDLGIFSLEAFPTLDIGKERSITLGSGFHFLNGPVATDMPPRLFDFQLAIHTRKPHSDNLILDTKISIGAFSDFEGSARKGIRFPGHVVGYYQLHPWLVSVLGVEFLDRDDVSLLPVVGCVWRPRDDIVAELVFPRPRLQVKTWRDKALIVSGELGGGTWAIERDNATNDNATLRDLRVMVGMMDFSSDHSSDLEIGWAFDRALAYRSGIGDYHPDDALIFRFRSHY